MVDPKSRTRLPPNPADKAAAAAKTPAQRREESAYTVNKVSQRSKGKSPLPGMLAGVEKYNPLPAKMKAPKPKPKPMPKFSRGGGKGKGAR